MARGAQSEEREDLKDVDGSARQKGQDVYEREELRQSELGGVFHQG